MTKEESGLSLNEFLKEINWGKDKFYENLKIMESDECYGLKRELLKKAGKVKEDYEKDEKNFFFKDEWKDLAIILFKIFDKNPYYKSNSNAKSADINDIIDYMDYSIKLVDSELPDFYKYLIELQPVFQYTIMERNLLKILIEKIQKLLSIMSKCSIEQRVELLFNLNKSVNKQLVYNYYKYFEAIEEIKKNREDLFKNQLYGDFEFGSLDNFIAEVLKKETDDEFIKERINICDKKAKAKDELNSILDTGITEEEKDEIDELWNKSGLDEYMEKCKYLIIREEVKKIVMENKRRVMVETDINTDIDEFIKTIENETDASDIKDKMNILKNKIFSDEADYENFKDISESIFKELNCNIIKRR